MAYYIERNGSPLSQRTSDTDPFVRQLSVTLERAIGERPVATMSVRIPAGAAFAVEDLDEITIDYPARPYRAEGEGRADLVAYWRLDEAGVTTAVDSHGNATPLTFGGGADLQYRAFRSEGTPVPYGAAPEWEHTTGAGLSGTLPAIGSEWTIAGFLRLAAGATGNREVWRSNTFARALRLSSDGRLTLRMDGQTATSPIAVIDDTWHHVAVTRTAARLSVLVDGVEVAAVVPQTETPIESRDFQMAWPIGGQRTDIALDEWGIWSSALDVAALYARARHERLFGGYVFGVVDRTLSGPEDEHALDLSMTGYGLRLDTSYVREVYASTTGSSVREIVADVLTRAGLGAVFSSHGVELDDIVTRAVYPVESVMTILRQLAETHGAIVTVDEWREIDMVRRNDVQHSGLVLSGANCASIGRTTEPRFFADRAVVVGRGESGLIEDVRTGNGVTTPLRRQPADRRRAEHRRGRRRADLRRRGRPVGDRYRSAALRGGDRRDPAGRVR